MVCGVCVLFVVFYEQAGDVIISHRLVSLEVLPLPSFWTSHYILTRSITTNKVVVVVEVVVVVVVAVVVVIVVLLTIVLAVVKGSAFEKYLFFCRYCRLPS